MEGDRPGGKISKQAGNSPPVDAALLARPAVQKALACHDIGALFRELGEHGWTQREIAKATRMPQSSVSEIVTGRRVSDYRVLARIADGLGIPRELMGLTSGDDGAYPGGTEPTGEMSEEVRAAMRRRAMLAAGEPGGGSSRLWWWIVSPWREAGSAGCGRSGGAPGCALLARSCHRCAPQR